MPSYKVTKGERLRVERRRLKVNQEVRAQQLSVTRHAYQSMEKDPRKSTRMMTLEDHEWCYLKRRRVHGEIQQRDIARILKVSRVWVNRMENGAEDCTRLVAFWNEQK